jgi:hypothetical protein
MVLMSRKGRHTENNKKGEKLVMGLFSKPNADSLFESFGKLPEEEQKLFLAKFQEPAEQEPEKVEEPQEETPKAEEGVAEQVEEPQTEEPKAEDKFVEYFKKFEEESNKRFAELKESFDKKFEELTKKHSEKKPFGLTENSKEYKATAKPKETSQDLLNKIFKK